MTVAGSAPTTTERSHAAHAGVGHGFEGTLAGETLSPRASDVYGDPSQYSRIVSAYPQTITDPDVIFVGQVLRIPVA